MIAESFERIHRSNLVGMGVLPLQYMEAQSTEGLGLTGTRIASYTGRLQMQKNGLVSTVCECAKKTHNSWGIGFPRVLSG